MGRFSPWVCYKGRSMNQPETKKNRSLKRVALSAILFGAIIILIMAVLVEIVLFIYPTLENYKRELDHEGSLVTALIGQEYLETVFDKVKDAYYSTPEEIRHDQYGDEYVSIIRPIADEEFLEARKILNTCKEQAKLENVYFTFFDEEYERLVYVIDGNDRKYAFLPGMWLSNENGTIDHPKTIERTLHSNWFLPVTYGTVQGWTATNYSEVYDSAGNVIGYMTMNITINSFARQIMMFLAIYIPVMVVVLIGIALLAAGAINKSIIVPINNLAGAARKYTSISKVERHVDTSVFEDLNIHTGDEIEQLWETMVDMEDDVSQAMKQIRDVTKKQERLATELDLAKNIQAAALPTDFKEISEKDEIELFAYMTPAKEVGGDFYDFFMIDEDHLGLVIADVSGKGIPAALFMMISKSLIKTRAMEGGSPSEILKFVNDSLCEDNINDMFVTVWLGILTISTGDVIAANAGHEYPFITGEDGKLTLYKDRHGMVIGAMGGIQYKDYGFKLAKGQRLFVYTDGVAEATNEKDELFGLERIEESLGRYDGDSPEGLIRYMKAEVDAFAGSMEQFDDITMLSLWYKG